MQMSKSSYLLKVGNSSARKKRMQERKKSIRQYRLEGNQKQYTRSGDTENELRIRG